MSYKHRVGSRHILAHGLPFHFLFFFCFLAVLCGTRSPNSSTSNWTRTPCIGSSESQPLDRQGISPQFIFKRFSGLLFCWYQYPQFVMSCVTEQCLSWQTTSTITTTNYPYKQSRAIYCNYYTLRNKVIKHQHQKQLRDKLTNLPFHKWETWELVLAKDLNESL